MSSLLLMGVGGAGSGVALTPLSMSDVSNAWLYNRDSFQSQFPELVRERVEAGSPSNDVWIEWFDNYQ